MIEIIKKNRYFFIPLAISLFIGLIITIYFSKAELHIITNRINTPFLDEFFKYTTYLGNGVVIAVVIVILLFVRYRWAITLAIGGVSALLLINFFKKVIFPQFLRPSKYFELYQDYQLHYVNGVNLYPHLSFPSGHTTAGFLLLLMLAFISKKNWVKLLCFVVALLIGYSRVYLSQHFMMDIVAGALLGSAIILFTYFWVTRWQKSWLNRSLLG